MQLLIAGFVVILFENMQEIKDFWSSCGILTGFGCLRVIYTVREYELTTGRNPTPKCYGQVIATCPNLWTGSSCLGLTLPQGLEAIITTIHGFVELKDIQKPLRLQILELLTGEGHD